MRNLMKLIAITVIAALLLCTMITCAAADEKIYTSPTFTLPADRLIRAEEIFDAREAEEEETEPEEAENPEEELTEDEKPAESEEPDEDEELVEGEEPTEGEEPVEGDEPTEGEEPVEGDEPAEGEELPEGEQPDEDVQPEEGEEPDEDSDLEEDEGFEELDEDAGEVAEELAKQKRQVIIKSSQGEVVTEGEVITLRCELIGFDDDEQVTYQWQVDRGEGNGWEDVEGATKGKHIFIADRNTIRYSWRLIVNVIDE